MNDPVQYLRVAAITPINECVSCFRLESAENDNLSTKDGTSPTAPKPLMPFKAGQYINIFYEIGKTKTSRPYSIASSPIDAQHGYYELFIHNGGPFTARWLFDNCCEGDVLKCSSPIGDFCFDPKRDTGKIIAISGGMSVTPLRSMARAVADGTLDIDLSIISGWDYKKELMFRDDFEDCAKRSDRFKAMFTVSFDENADGDTVSESASENRSTTVTVGKKPGTSVCAGAGKESGCGTDCGAAEAEPCAEMSTGIIAESGYCDGEMIRRYCDIEDATFFLCGPQEMYDALYRELDRLGVPRHRIHIEIPGELQTPAGQPDYPGASQDAYALTFAQDGVRRTVPASAHETLLVALERAGIPTDAHCRCGCCPHCEGKVVKGRVYIPAIRDFRTDEQKKENRIHLCCAFPLGNVEVEGELL